MEQPGLGPAILRFVRNVGITVMCILVLAGLSCLPAAWRTSYRLGNRVLLLGVLVAVVGVSSTAGSAAAAGAPLSTLSSDQRVKHQIAYAMSSYRFSIATGLAGLVAIFVGSLIRRAGLSALGIR